MASKVLSRKVTIYVNGKEVESTISSLQSAMTKLQHEQKRMTIGSEEYVKASLKIKEIKSVLEAQKIAVRDLGKDWDETRKAAAQYGNILEGLKTATGKVSGIYNWAKGFVDEAAKMDDAYADVMKTTGLTHDEVLKLNEAFKKMDTRTAREELNQLASAAGKLGITGVEGVASFTAAADKIRVALGEDLGEDATTVIGKMADVYTRSTKELADAGDDLGEKMLRIGSAVNSLGAASSAAEPHMVDFLARLGGMASQAGLSAQQVLGYASALDQSGVSVEKSATAFQNFMAKMMQKPAEFAAIARKSLAEFRQLMETDMDAAIKAVLAGLNEEGGMTKLAPIFKDLQMAGSGVTTMLTTLKGSLDKVTEAQAIATEQMSTGASIAEEFNTKNNTMEAQLEKAKDRLHDNAVELGDALYPALVKVTEAGGSLVNGLTGLTKLLGKHPAVIWAVIAALAAWNKERILSAALWLKELPSLIQSKIHKLSEARATAKNTAALASEHAARTKALVQRIKERIEIEQGILSRRKELLAAGQVNTVLKAESTLRRLKISLTKAETIATEASTAATKAKVAALNRIPFMLIISALTAIVAKVISANRATSKFDEIMKETDSRITQTSIFIDDQFRVLRKATKGSSEYKTAIDNLKEAYPGLIEKEIDHKGNLKDIESAYNNIKTAAMDAVYAEIKANRLREALEEAGNEVADLEQKAIDKFVRKHNGIVPQTWLDDRVNEISTAFSKLNGYISGWNEADKYMHNGAWTAYVNNYLVDAQRVLEKYRRLEQQVNKSLKGLRPTVESSVPGSDGTSTTGNSYSGGGDEKEAERRLKAWERVKKRAEKMAAEATAKAESGLAKVESEVRVKFASMREELKEAATAAGQSADETLAALDKAEQALLKSKVDEYLKKQKEELRKLGKQLKGSDANKYIAQIEDAERKLADQIKTIDDNMAAAEQDAKRIEEDEIARLNEKLEVATDEAVVTTLRKEIEERRKNVDSIRDTIEQYKQLKRQYADNVYNAIGNTAKTEAQPLSGGHSRLGEETQGKVDEKISSYGMLFDKNAFDAYGRAIEGINAKYKEQLAAKNEEKEAEDAIIGRLQARATLERDPEEQLRLKAQIQAHREKAEQIDQERANLDELKASAEQAAEEDAFGSAIDRWIIGIEQFGQMAMQAWGSVNQILDNIAQRELNEAKKQKEENERLLDEQLDNGLISQEEHDEQKQALQDEYDAKEKAVQLEQWKRQKLLNVSQATMQGALAVLQALASAPPPYNAVLAAISAGLAALQIAAIASEPEPYARGGYVEKKTYMMAGEAGREWVASNSLLRDPATAPIVDALDQYQQGRRSPLDRLTMATLNMPAATSAAERIGQSHTAAQPSAAAVWEHPAAASVGSDSHELVKLMRDLNHYMKDPHNRQAVISRKTMEDFDRNENFLRSRSRM